MKELYKNKELFKIKKEEEEENTEFIPKFVLNLGDNFYDNGIGKGEEIERYNKVTLI
jgi:hypothetical protein